MPSLAYQFSSTLRPAIGAGETSCENRLLSTGYGSVASDPDSSNTYCYTYFEDCDPFGETAFVPQ